MVGERPTPQPERHQRHKLDDPEQAHREVDPVR